MIFCKNDYYYKFKMKILILTWEIGGCLGKKWAWKGGKEFVGHFEGTDLLVK